MIRIAVLGESRMHVENIHAHPRATLAGGYDVMYGAAQDVSAKLGVPAFASVDEMLASPDVDAILIATPNHADLIERAVSAGRPMLCEEPVGLSLARVDACAERDAVRAGKIGDIHQVLTTSRDAGLAPEGYLAVSGDILRDTTIHDFDKACLVLDEEVVSEQASGSRLMDLMATTSAWRLWARSEWSRPRSSRRTTWCSRRSCRPTRARPCRACSSAASERPSSMPSSRSRPLRPASRIAGSRRSGPAVRQEK